MLNVAFVYAPIGHCSFEENLRVVDEDFGRLNPLSLSYAAAIAEKAGHRVTIVDANALRLTPADTLARLRPFRPDVLGFSLSTYMFHNTTRWMKLLRDALRVPTIAGGVNLWLYPRETLEHEAVDYGVRGFGLRGLPALLDALERGIDPAGLPEVVARSTSGEVVVGEVDWKANPYPELPQPARHLLPNDRYYSIISQRRNFTVMVTGTGCAFTCRYCAIAPLPRFRNPLDRVMEEITDCVRTYDVREIDFFDADFFGQRKAAVELCECLVAANLDLEWSCRSRIDILDASLLELACRAGCRRIFVGIETPDPRALRAMRKKVRVSDVRLTLETMRRIGIRPLGFFMIGVPGETHRSALATIGYAVSLPLDYAQFSRMIPKPGSELHEDLKKRTRADFWADYVLGRPVPARLPNFHSRISEDVIEAYTKLAYLAFYYRPNHVARALLRMRSWDEISRSARTALRMLTGLKDRDGRKP
ncbi:MAG: B12-binding domain-containing radical SAM protein [Deltaproteobacteria bacterium]|nr:B12-binding domain-containing radical SAM protein [Deltaproteobacteria bacterium]